MPTPVPPEIDEQATVVTVLRRAGVPVFAVPNAGRRSKRERARALREGLEAGVPDLIIPAPPRGRPQDAPHVLRGLLLRAGVPREYVEQAAAAVVEWLDRHPPAFALEMKRRHAPGHRARGPTPKQREWLATLAAAGWATGVGFGSDDALSALREAGYVLENT